MPSTHVVLKAQGIALRSLRYSGPDSGFRRNPGSLPIVAIEIPGNL